MVTADGRNAIERGERRYDLIEADALWPYTGYSGNLYSEEFFARCARRLAPGGIMCTWAPTPRVYATFPKVFPYVLDAGAILVGSLEPIRGTGEEWASTGGRTPRCRVARTASRAPRATGPPSRGPPPAPAGSRRRHQSGSLPEGRAGDTAVGVRARVC